MRNKTLFQLFGLATLGVLGGATTLVATATFTFRHPMGETFRVDRAGRVVAKRPIAKAAADVAQSDSPRAVVTTSEHDFGIMDPLTMGTHSFAIRNDGDGPLTLREGPTSCKCTLSRLTSNVVAPGETVTVNVTWNTGRDRLYAHEATILTNDPLQPEISLRILGTVRTQLGIDPPEALFGSIKPDAVGSTKFVVFSQVSDAIDFELLDSSLEGVTFEVAATAATVLDEYQARAAYQVTVQTAPEMPKGEFRERLRIRATPRDDPSQAQTLDIPLVGRVQGRLLLFGKGIDPTGVLDFGQIAVGRGTKIRLALKVRDELSTLNITKLAVRPDFLKVDLQPPTSDAALGFLELEVPADAPLCVYNQQMPGEVNIEFDHPRIPDLRLQVRLAIVKQ